MLDRGYLNELLGSNLFAGAVYVLLATGAIACCAAIFGCIGAAKEVKCVLLTVSQILSNYTILNYIHWHLLLRFQVTFVKRGSYDPKIPCYENPRYMKQKNTKFFVITISTI